MPKILIIEDNADLAYGLRTGLEIEGSTQYQEGYYTGEHVAKVSDN